jgi:hypothetical protein
MGRRALTARALTSSAPVARRPDRRSAAAASQAYAAAGHGHKQPSATAALGARARRSSGRHAVPRPRRRSDRSCRRSASGHPRDREPRMRLRHGRRCSHTSQNTGRLVRPDRHCPDSKRCADRGRGSDRFGAGKVRYHEPLAGTLLAAARRQCGPLCRHAEFASRSLVSTTRHISLQEVSPSALCWINSAVRSCFDGISTAGRLDPVSVIEGRPTLSQLPASVHRGGSRRAPIV